MRVPKRVLGFPSHKKRERPEGPSPFLLPWSYSKWLAALEM